jgi:hypothetical protein
MERIEFRKGGRRAFTEHLDPADVLAGLEEVRLSHGGKLTPEDTVADATPEESLLHPAFEWDEASAAHQFRLSQARAIIRSVVIVRDEQAPVPAYLHVDIHRAEQQRERYYQHTDVIVERPDEFAAAIRVLRRKFEEARSALEMAQRLGKQATRSDVDLELLSRIGDALAAAQTMAGRIH